MFGANDFSKALALELKNHDVESIIADTNWDAIKKARMENIRTYFGNPISDHASRHLDLTGIGSVLILSPYRQLNPMVMTHFEHELGKDAPIWGLTTADTAKHQSHKISEEFAKKMALFSEKATYGYLVSAIKKGAIIKTTAISDEFTYQDYLSEYDENLIPLLSISDKKVAASVAGKKFEPKSGWKIVSLILPQEKQGNVPS